MGPGQYTQYTRAHTKGGCGSLVTPRPQNTTRVTSSEPNTLHKTYESRMVAELMAAKPRGRANGSVAYFEEHNEFKLAVVAGPMRGGQCVQES